MSFKTFIKILKTVVLMTTVFVLFVLFQVVRTGMIDHAKKADAIVVLGAAEYHGKPSPVLKARLDHGYDLYIKGLAPLIITTGGKNGGDVFSEGGVGKTYLIRRGVPEEKIIAEEASQSTKQNLNRTAEIAQEHGIKTINLVSDPFHLYRGKLMADENGLTAYTSPVKESPISQNFWLQISFIVKEVLAVIAHFLLRI